MIATGQPFRELPGYPLGKTVRAWGVLPDLLGQSMSPPRIRLDTTPTLFAANT